MRNHTPVNNNRNTIRNLFVIADISVVSGFGVYFAIVLWAFPLFTINVSEPRNWSLLEGFASVLSLSLLAGGVVFAAIEYINTENSKQAEKLAEDREKTKLSYEIYNSIYHKLTDPEQEAARRWILMNITIKKEDEDIETWYERMNKVIMQKTKNDKDRLPEGQVAVKLTLNCLDYIGFIAKTMKQRGPVRIRTGPRFVTVISSLFSLYPIPRPLHPEFRLCSPCREALSGSASRTLFPACRPT